MTGAGSRLPEHEPTNRLTEALLHSKLSAMITDLAQYKRITIKIGSSLLVDRSDGLKSEWLQSLGEDLAGLSAQGAEILIVSSGAIALGRTILGLPPRPLKLEESQAAASVGQIALGPAYKSIFGNYGINVGQILLTLEDTEDRRRYLNARNTITTMLKWGVIPVINENDTVATSEIRYGDNDRLAARVATMMGSDLLILLSDIDGLYTKPPKENPDAEFVAIVGEITPVIEAMAGSAGSDLSRGGMVTKIEAGKVATKAGTAMVITSGIQNNPVSRLQNGKRATWFKPATNKSRARKKWIAGQLETNGTLLVDTGAKAALLHGKSLLPAGVTGVEGSFQRGDTVVIMENDRQVLGRGLVAFDATDACLIAGCQSRDIAEILGYEGRSEIIHRDDMVLETAGLQNDTITNEG